MFARLRNARDTALGALGGVFRRAERQRGIRVFRYHGVIEKRTDALLERNQHLLEVFRAQMRYLRRFHVLGLDELLETLERPDRWTIRPAPPPS